MAQDRQQKPLISRDSDGACRDRTGDLRLAKCAGASPGYLSATRTRSVEPNPSPGFLGVLRLRVTPT